jgi:transposase-like protein
MGLTGISKSTVSKLCKDIDERVSAFLERPLSDEWPYLWLDATYLRQREGGRVVSVAAIVAVACDAEGRRQIVGLHIGPSEAETFWAAFLKSLIKRGLRGVKLVVSDAHEGLKGAIARVLGATWQRCRVHWMRNALAHVPRAHSSMAAAALRQAFLQPDQPGARQTWRQVADQFRPRWPKLGLLMDESEDDVLAYLGFPAAHRTKLHSVNTLERLNKGARHCLAQAAGRCGRHLSLRSVHHPPDRRRAAGSKRRMATPATLPECRSPERVGEPDTRQRDTATSTQGRISHGHLSYTQISTTLTDVTSYRVMASIRRRIFSPSW